MWPDVRRDVVAMSTVCGASVREHGQGMASALQDEDLATALARVAVDVRETTAPATLTAQLRLLPSIVSVDDPGSADVVVLVTAAADEHTAAEVASLLAQGAGHVVLVASTVDSAGISCVLEAGASAVVRRAEATPARLSDVVAAAARGDGIVPRELLSELFAPLRSNGVTMTAAHFTQREIDVLRLVADGYGTDEIARTLAYSERTVKNVIHDVTTRFHLRTRSHAVAFALRAGVL